MSHSTWGSYCQLPSRHRPAILFPVPPRIKPHQRYIPAIALILQSIWRLKKKLGLLVVFFYLYFYLFSYLSLFYFPAILLFTPYWGVASKYATSFEKKNLCRKCFNKESHLSRPNPNALGREYQWQNEKRWDHGKVRAVCLLFCVPPLYTAATSQWQIFFHYISLFQIENQRSKIICFRFAN